MDASLLVPYLVDWAGFLARWLHIVAGIAWIGASFYFVWLDNHLREPPAELKARGVAGHLWAVHGGGFYNPQKYLVAPAELPRELHWFKWEAYVTWLSGMALLVLVYYANAQAMLAGPAGHGPAVLIGISLASLLVAWIVYDVLARLLGERPLLLGVLLAAFFTAAAWLLAQHLGGRAAALHVGAMIGTVMAANVLMVIIPGQRRMVAAMREGQSPDARDGARSKQRSVHNNYLTLPVLFLMISNHSALITHHPHSWAVLALIGLAGVAIRHFFNRRHKGATEWRWPLLGALLIAAVIVWLAPRPDARPATGERTTVPTLAQVQAIMQARCVSCHAKQPTYPGFAAAPAGVMLETPAQLRQHAQKVLQQTVLTQAMPIGNLTQMTAEERRLVGAWVRGGMP